MKFLIDAQLPKKLAQFIQSLGFDAVHTLDLPDRNLTSDHSIIRIATREKRVIITKDRDFVNSLIIQGEPDKLLFVTTGNLTNPELLNRFRDNWNQIVALLKNGSYLELSMTTLRLHF